MKSPLLASLLLVSFYLDASSDKDKLVAKKSKTSKRVLARKVSNLPEAVVLTKTNLKETLNKKLVIVMVGADWCSFCKKMVPVFKESMNNTGDTAAYASLSLGQHFGDTASLIKQLQTNYQIKEPVDLIPSFLVFKSGKFIEQIKGSQTKEQLTALVKKHSEEKVIQK